MATISVSRSTAIGDLIVKRAVLSISWAFCCTTVC